MEFYTFTQRCANYRENFEQFWNLMEFRAVSSIVN